MITYAVLTHAGETIEIVAESIAQAARELQKIRPGVTVLSIEPASLQRAVDQQA